MIMNRIRIIGIIILTLSAVSPTTALAEWKVYYTGKAAGMFGTGGCGRKLKSFTYLIQKFALYMISLAAASSY